MKLAEILIPEPGSLPAPDGGPREPGVVGPPPPIVGGAIPQHFAAGLLVTAVTA